MKLLTSLSSGLERKVKSLDAAGKRVVMLTKILRIGMSSDMSTRHTQPCAQKKTRGLPAASFKDKTLFRDYGRGRVPEVRQPRCFFGLVLKTSTEECVWSIGKPAAGGHENWDHLMSEGQRKIGRNG